MVPTMFNRMLQLPDEVREIDVVDPAWSMRSAMPGGDEEEDDRVVGHLIWNTPQPKAEPMWAPPNG